MDLEAIAEGDTHARWIVEHHIGNGTKRERCVICDSWWPCDLVSLAALAVLRTQERDHWQRMATQHQIERDGLRRTLADLLGMHPAEACPECGDTEPHRHLATT